MALVADAFRNVHEWTKTTVYDYPNGGWQTQDSQAWHTLQIFANLKNLVKARLSKHLKLRTDPERSEVLLHRSVHRPLKHPPNCTPHTLVPRKDVHASTSPPPLP